MSTEELVREYRAQGYTQEHSEHLAKLTADDVVLTPDAPAEESEPAMGRAKGKSAGTRRGRGLGADSALATPKVADTHTSSEAATSQGEMRAWAKAKGIKVPARGTLPKLVREMWEQEHHVTA